MKIRKIWVALIVLVTVTVSWVSGCNPEPCESQRGEYWIHIVNPVVEEGESIEVEAILALDYPVDSFASRCFEGYLWEYTSIDGGEVSFSSNSLTWERTPGGDDLGLTATVLVTGIHTGSVRISIYNDDKFPAADGNIDPIIEVIESVESDGEEPPDGEESPDEEEPSDGEVDECDLVDGVVIITDNTFDTTKWQEYEFVNNAGNTSEPLAQDSDNENTYGSMRFDMTDTIPEDEGNRFGMYYLFNDGTYDPNICGVIERISYSAKINIWDIPGMHTGGIAHGLVILQNNKVYVGGVRSYYEHEWGTISVEGLTADAFTDNVWEPDQGGHPDFSQPMQFGFVRYGVKYSVRLSAIRHAIDDWVVEIVPVSSE